MSGRPPIKVYQYDKDGKYIQLYNCTNDARRKYYENAAYPMFRDPTGSPLHRLPDDTFLCKTRIGRNAVRFQVARMNSPFTLYGGKGSEEPIELLNLDGQVIAEFVNIYIAAKVLRCTTGQLYRMISSSCMVPQNIIGDVKARYKNAIDE